MGVLRRLKATSGVALAVAVIGVGGCSSGPLRSSSSPSGSAGPSTPTPSVVMVIPAATDSAASQDTVSAQPGGVGGGDAVYLETPPGAVLLVRWTERDGQLEGVFTVTDAAPTSAGTTSTSTSFTGLLDHRHLTLTLNKGLGSTTTLTGSVNGDQLLLTVPQDDGQLVDAPFTESSVTAYNAAVAQLADQGHQAADAAASATAQARANAQASAAAAAAAAETTRENELVIAAGTKLSTAIDYVIDADTTLKGLDATLADELGDERTARHTVDTDYAAAVALSKQCTDTSSGDLGAAVGDVGAAVGDVDAAQGTVEAEAASVGNAVDAVTSAVSDARTALADLVNAQQQYPASAGQVEGGAAQALDSVAGPATSRARKAAAAITEALTTAQAVDDSAQAVSGKADRLTSC